MTYPFWGGFFDFCESGNFAVRVSLRLGELRYGRLDHGRWKGPQVSSRTFPRPTHRRLHQRDEGLVVGIGLVFIDGRLAFAGSTGFRGQRRGQEKAHKGAGWLAC